MSAIAETAPVMGRAFRRVKSVMQSNGSMLKEAIGEVTRLNAVRDAVLVETAGKLAGGRIGGFTALITPTDDDFRRRYPQWKDALLNLCRARIEQAEVELLPILAEAQQRYKSHGFDDEDVETDLILRRARGKIAAFKSRLSRIEGGSPGEIWQGNVGALLQ